VRRTCESGSTPPWRAGRGRLHGRRRYSAGCVLGRDTAAALARSAKVSSTRRRGSRADDRRSRSDFPSARQVLATPLPMNDLGQRYPSGEEGGCRSADHVGRVGGPQPPPAPCCAPAPVRRANSLIDTPRTQCSRRSSAQRSTSSNASSWPRSTRPSQAHHDPRRPATAPKGVNSQPAKGRQFLTGADNGRGRTLRLVPEGVGRRIGGTLRGLRVRTGAPPRRTRGPRSSLHPPTSNLALKASGRRDAGAFERAVGCAGRAGGRGAVAPPCADLGADLGTNSGQADRPSTADPHDARRADWNAQRPRPRDPSRRSPSRWCGDAGTRCARPPLRLPMSTGGGLNGGDGNAASAARGFG
jgi:hypothetical protein